MTPLFPDEPLAVDEDGREIDVGGGGRYRL